MIITCPSCSTNYEIGNNAIAAVGKSVRCSNCGNKWHQMPVIAAAPPPPPPAAAPPPQPAAAPAPEPPPPAPEPPPPAPEPPPPASEPEPEPAPAEPDAPPEESPSDEELEQMLGPEEDPESGSMAPEAAEDLTDIDEEALESLPDPEPLESIAPGEVGDDDAPEIDPDDIPDPDPIPGVFSESEDDFEDAPSGRRKLWISIAAVLILLIGIGSGGYFGRFMIVEIWPASIGIFDLAGLSVPVLGEGLEIRRTRSSRETDDGKPVIIVRGIIANIAAEQKDVPMIRVSLLDATNQIVQSIQLPPLKSSLAPKEEIGFRARLVDPVPTARGLEVTFVEAPPAEEGEKKDSE